MSVRDILDVVGGAPGMFYYYFKSKQEIYIATMELYITERLERKCEVIENQQIPFEEKMQVFRSMVAEDIHGYANGSIQKQMHPYRIPLINCGI